MHQKRLVTVFGEKSDAVLYENDVIITNNTSYLDPSHKVVYITTSDVIDKDDTLMNSIQQAFIMLPDEYRVVQNSIYHMILRPIVHMLAMIDRVITQEQIDEIWLYGGSEVEFLSLSNSEGEGAKKLYYSSWLFNPIIDQYFSENDNIKVVWQRKKSRITYTILYWFREHYNYYRRTLGYLVRDFREEKSHICIEKSDTKIVLALADLELQYKHLAKQIEQIDCYDKLFVLGRNVKPEKTDVFCRLPSLSAFSIMKIMRTIRKIRVRNKRMSFCFNGHEVWLRTNNIIMGSKERLFIALYQAKALSQLVEGIGTKKIQCICTNRTMGTDICYIQNVCNKYDILHVNFQYVSMQEILYPNMNVADRYYLYSKRVYELYKKYGKQFKYYLPLDTHCFEERNEQAHRIVIFTQPDTYTDRYLMAIKEILTCFQQNGSQIEIIIKLHYRQDKIDEFISCEKYYRNTKVLTTGNAGEVMRTCDCVISMTSSVLFESLLEGIPTIVLDFDGIDRALIEESGICVPEVNYVVHSPQDILSLITNYSYFWREYHRRLHEFIGDNGSPASRTKYLFE